MTLEEAITRWDNYLTQITEMLDALSEEIQNDKFADSSDAITLICLHSQLCTARATALLGGNLMKSTLGQIMKAGVKHNDQSKNY